MSIYVVRVNTDLMEGRGMMADRGAFASLEQAVEFANQPRDMGGGPSAEVVEYDDGVCGGRVWGYRQGANGRWSYGYLDLRDEPHDDPEYAEYVRLRKRFG